MLKELLVSERTEAVVADHDVVEDADADDLAGPLEPSRDRAVLGRRVRVARRVVVDEDQRRGVRKDRGLEDLPRVNERGAIVLTSNQSLGAWGDVFGDPVIATALLDRLLHHSITVNIRGESYRLREKLKAGLLKPKLGGETMAAAEGA